MCVVSGTRIPVILRVPSRRTVSFSKTLARPCSERTLAYMELPAVPPGPPSPVLVSTLATIELTLPHNVKMLFTKLSLLVTVSSVYRKSS